MCTSASRGSAGKARSANWGKGRESRQRVPSGEGGPPGPARSPFSEILSFFFSFETRAGVPAGKARDPEFRPELPPIMQPDTRTPQRSAGTARSGGDGSEWRGRHGIGQGLSSRPNGARGRWGARRTRSILPSCQEKKIFFFFFFKKRWCSCGEGSGHRHSPDLPLHA